MGVNFTSQQQNAIESRGGSLIVSAAAGSGKTAVLVQRVIEMITGKENIDIDSLLIVTFTNAAASEMRGKIADALIKLLAENPNSRNLKRQLALLGSSKIQTVHAFCQDIVRRNFVACGVSPSFRLMDSAESELLREQAIGEYLDAVYENTPSDDFEKFADNFCEERGDTKLQQIILGVYEKLRSHYNPKKWLENAVEICRIGAKNGEKSPEYCVELLADCRKKLAYHAELLKKSYEMLREEPDIFAKYSPAFEDCLAFAAAFIGADAKDWNRAFELLDGFSKPRLNAVRGADKEFTDKMKYARDFFCDAVEQMRKEAITKPISEIQKEMALSLPILRGLMEAVNGFTEEYASLKNRRMSLDFSDLEHLTLGLLMNTETDEKTEYATELGSEFAEILVDEFQDTNEIQECIFNALKQDTNGIFMVGDVKQSIYRFRLAEPSIFVDKYYSYDDYEANPQSNRRRITLNKNFRSRSEVLELTNYIFSHIMSREFGSIDYNENEYLYTGAKYEGACPAEVYFLETNRESTDDEIDLTKAEYEAQFVAQTIEQQLHETQVTDGQTGELRNAMPQDIVILLSSFANKAPIFQEALLKKGIPCEGAYSGNMYNSLEISVMRSLLAIVDNPRQDIPLISVLRSPLYFFSADELLELRTQDKKISFYDAVIISESEHCKKFMENLNEWRSRAPDCNVSQLISLIYAQTNALGIFEALDGGAMRRENLDELFFLAIRYEKNGSRGLFGFLKYLEKRAEEGEGATDSTANAVKIMSVHRSKGLEFPIVVLPDLSKRFNTDDLKGKLLMHKDIGIGITLRDLERATETQTQLHRAIMMKHMVQSREEEMRKLYVAMTRAKEKLIMTVSMAKIPDKLSKLAAMLSEKGEITPEAVAMQPSAEMYICAPLLSHPDCNELREAAGLPESMRSGEPTGKVYCKIVGYLAEENPEEGNIADLQPMEQLTLDMDKWKAIQNFEYAHAKAVELPSKLTPTGLRELDSDSAILEAGSDGPIVKMFRGAGNKAKLGTLAHLCMQKCDYAKCETENGASAELDRLVETGEISQKERDLVKAEYLVNFCASELGRLAAKSECLREYQFSALIPAGELLKDAPMDEDILMNGVIDLLIKTANGAIIIDFKSDGVKHGAESFAAQKYKTQLEIYANAAEKILEIKVTNKFVCFLATGACIEI